MSARSFVSVASLLVAFAGCASSGTDLSEPAESAAEEIGAAGSALTASCDADSDCGGGARCVTKTNRTRVCCDAQCQASLTIHDQIRNEALKSSDDAERPLPLASLWCSGPSAEAVEEIRDAVIAGYEPHVDGGAPNLAYQLQLIAAQHHLLPVVDSYLPIDDNQPTDWVWAIHSNYPASAPPGSPSELSLFNTKMATPMTQLAALYLPLTVMTVQPEDMVDRLTRPWLASAKADLFHCPPYPGRHPGNHEGCFFSPFADPTSFYNMGVELAHKNQILSYQDWYPDPPAVVFLNNNESDREWNWIDAMADPRAPAFQSTSYMTVNPGVSDPNAAAKKLIDEKWVHLYREMQRGFDDGLVERSGEDWKTTKKWHVAYHSTLLSHEDSIYNSAFKPDQSIYQPCCASADPDQCRGLMAPANQSDPVVCYHAQASPRRPCRSDDASVTDCKKPAAARAAHGAWQETIANLGDRASTRVPGKTMYASNDPDDLAEMRKAAHFVNDAWPGGSPAAPTVDKIYRMWDGTSFTGGVPNEAAEYMTGGFLLSAGFSPLLLDEKIHELRPDFWAETYSVAASDNVSAQLWSTNAQTVFSQHPQLTKERARGASQLFLWMSRPRVVRNFDVCFGSGNHMSYAERFLQADLEAVDAVWNDPTLKSFWRDSEMVENAEYTAKLRVRGIRPFHENAMGEDSRYWFLQTSKERSSFVDWRTSNDPYYGLNTTAVGTDVVAIARKQASATPPRYLVYAFTQKQETQKQVVIKVPGAAFDTITVDVAQGGSFFVVNDPPSNPAAPALGIASISPALVNTDVGDFTLTVNGSGFVAKSAIALDGVPLATSYVSPTKLTAVVPRSVARPGSHPVTIASPAPGGGVSSAATLVVRAGSCFELLATGTTTNGLYTLDPDGSGPAAPLDAYCDITGGGWTLIASQPTLVNGDFRSLYGQTPQPQTAGALQHYLQSNLRQPGMEIRVTNIANESHVFETAQFTGPLVLDGPNFYDAAHTGSHGIIAGNAYPVVNHFQVGQPCGTAHDCRGQADSYNMYSNGFLAVFDWQDSDTATNGVSHAHFGGKPLIEGTGAGGAAWARRGTELAVRSRNLATHGVRASCLAHRDAGELVDALYLVDPDGAGPTAPFLAWCDMTTAGGGWSLIASQDVLFGQNMALSYGGDPAYPETNGVLGYYMQQDLTTQVSEIRVVNSAGETHTFHTADFYSPLKFDGPNLLNAADNRWSGVVYGNAFPVVDHYQVATACGSSNCLMAMGSSPQYSRGLAIVFDWDDADLTLGPNPAKHAHFGGTSTIETNWSRRGTLLYVR